MTEITKLLTRWGTDEGKPYRGSLIDMASYEPGNLSCMCAQGAHIMRERGQPFFFLPLFGFDNPEAITPLPADYGGGIMTADEERALT